MSEGFTSFLCRHCRSEIEASPDMIGEETECPACGGRFVIPDNRDDGVTRHSKDEDDSASVQAMKSRTIRIDRGDL